MYCFKRRKYREIADELNIPLGTVKNVLNQTREKLKRKIIN
jgi:DNA-directed RNA polymerase specialized sigma24 family protein